MDLSAIPYLVISRELDFGFTVRGPHGAQRHSKGSTERVYLCLCLLDHLVLGVGLSRDEAMGHMVDELNAKYDGKLDETDDDDGFELDSVRRN